MYILLLLSYFFCILTPLKLYFYVEQAHKQSESANIQSILQTYIYLPPYKMQLFQEGILYK